MDDPICKTKFQIVCVCVRVLEGREWSDLVEVSVIVAERSKTG